MEVEKKQAIIEGVEEKSTHKRDQSPKEKNGNEGMLDQHGRKEMEMEEG